MLQEIVGDSIHASLSQRDGGRRVTGRCWVYQAHGHIPSGHQTVYRMQTWSETEAIPKEKVENCKHVTRKNAQLYTYCKNESETPYMQQEMFGNNRQITKDRVCSKGCTHIVAPF